MVQRDLIFDVGLHRGEDTDFYLRKGYRVVAFEANPDLVRHCENRFQQEIANGQLQIVEGAVSTSSARRIHFFVNRAESQWGTLDANWVKRNERRGAPSFTIEVDTIDIMEAFGRWGMPYYLKIDIEGSDIEVVKLLSSVADRPKYLSFETDITHYERAKEEITLLHNLGCRRFKPVQQQFIVGSRIKTETIDGHWFDYCFERGATGPFGADLPGPWLDYADCLAAYKKIFRIYSLVGHNSILFRRGWLRMQGTLDRLFGPSGWHDLHGCFD